MATLNTEEINTEENGAASNPCLANELEQNDQTTATMTGDGQLICAVWIRENMSLRPVFLLQVELDAMNGNVEGPTNGEKEAFLRYLEAPGEAIFHICLCIKLLSVEFFFFCRYSFLMYA